MCIDELKLFHSLSLYRSWYRESTITKLVPDLCELLQRLLAWMNGVL